MSTNSKQIITRLDELTERVATLEAQIIHPETHSESLPYMDPVVTSPVSTHMINLSELKEKFNGLMWMILEVIGKEGLSKHTEIAPRLKEQAPYLKKSCLQKTFKILVAMRILDEYKFSIPSISRVMLYSLTDIGDRIFTDKFYEKPIESEMAVVKKNYHSLEHGYEILALKKVLTNSGRYKEVSVFNRDNKNNIGAKFEYYPDLMCVSMDGSYTECFEYDLGTTGCLDLIKKCRKMRNVTKCLNFIFPNKKILVENVFLKVDEMVKEYGHGCLRDTVIRLSTSNRFSTINDELDKWWIVYDTNTG